MNFITPEEEIRLLQEILQDLQNNESVPFQQDIKRKLTYDAVTWYLHYAYVEYDYCWSSSRSNNSIKSSHSSG